QQPLAGGAGQLGNRQGHLLRQLQPRVVSRGGAVGILRHGGPLLVECLGGCPTPTPRQVTGGGPPPQLLRRPGQPPSPPRCPYPFAPSCIWWVTARRSSIQPATAVRVVAAAP